MKSRFQAVLFASIATLTAHASRADWNPEVPGSVLPIESGILGATRAISVVLPSDYESSTSTRYDVLYVLDAEDDAKRVLEIVRALGDRQGFIPPVIVVNVWTMIKWDRDHDLTPTHVNEVPTSGGGPKFLGFLRDELIPYMDSHYRTAGRILYGHSYGGLFGMYTLLNEPALFESVVLTDPALWYDNGQVVRSAAQKFRDGTFTGKTLWIGGRDGRDHERMGITAMETALRMHAPKDLQWRSEVYADETHFSILHKSAYDGLKFAYSGFAGNEGLWFVPTGGVIARGLPFPFIVDSRLPRNPPLRYTTDGSAPSLTSPPLNTLNLMRTDAATAQVTLRSFGFRPRHDKAIKIEYTLGAIWPAAGTSQRAEAGGLCYSYYEGEWEKLPDFRKLRALRYGVASSSSLPALPRTKNFGLVLDGSISVPETAHFVFVLDSDDGSRLWIDGHRIIDNDGMHGLGAAKDFVVPLEKGMHSIRVEYFQRGGGAQLILKYIPPGATEAVGIPLPQQFCPRARKSRS